MLLQMGTTVIGMETLKCGSIVERADFGKNRWNCWGEIAAQQRDINSEDLAMKQEYWPLVYRISGCLESEVSQKGFSNKRSNENDNDAIEAFNGIDWVWIDNAWFHVVRESNIWMCASFKCSAVSDL